MSRLGDLGAQLQSGERSFNFIARRRTFFLISLMLVVISALGLGVRHLDLGVEFKGGAVFEATKSNISVADVRDAVAGAGVAEPRVQKLGTDRVRVETGQLTAEQAQPVQQALAKKLGIPLDEITTQVVGPSWGSDVTSKALTSLVIFLSLLVIYLAFAFELKMAAGALIALIHDLIITIGIYAIVGFQVTPATVIGLLTILGYSLYDTVVVFDKVRENTANLTAGNRMTYSGAANLAVNQTLVRSVNTTVIALLPVGALLFVGAGLLGAGTLKDLALVLFVGMAVGAYSSIFLATPVVAALKEREPQMQALGKRVAQREASQRKAAAAAKGVDTAKSLTKPPAQAAAKRPAAATARTQPDPDVGDDVGDEVDLDEDPATRPRPGGTAGTRPQPAKPGPRSTRRPTGKKRR
jgi:preprotein translocase subunit SecF